MDEVKGVFYMINNNRLKLYLKSKLTLSLVLALLILPQVSAETWDFNNHSVGVAGAYEFKTNDTIFEDSKIILDAQYIVESRTDDISEKLSCCSRPALPVNMQGLMDAKLNMGLDGTGLEFISINYTPWATRWESEDNSRDEFHIEWDLLELGAMRYVSDDALEVDSYFEFSILRVGRLLAYRWSEDSAYAINMGLQASLGYALARSVDRTYSNVSNPFAGVFFKLSIEHHKFGELYSINRFVNGFSISNPSRGHPTAREARVRVGYLYNINLNLKLDVYGEKRSFYFDEGGLPALYTSSGIFGLQVLYHW